MIMTKYYDKLCNKYFQNLDLVNCIENICSKLKTHRGLYNVFPITTAKVPIVKFRHRRSQLEGDISMYNLLVSVSVKCFLSYLKNIFCIAYILNTVNKVKIL
jgi:DNA polymerase sigma